MAYIVWRRLVLQLLPWSRIWLVCLQRRWRRRVGNSFDRNNFYNKLVLLLLISSFGLHVLRSVLSYTWRCVLNTLRIFITNFSNIQRLSMSCVIKLVRISLKSLIGSKSTLSIVLMEQIIHIFVNLPILLIYVILQDVMC